ncbi:MAG: hypothetical protein E7326_06940 [Clostridiales bacterium]|nr:hypothetical protein [Clostridiales bacterium]
MKNLKRYLALLLTVCMLLGSVNVPALAAAETTLTVSPAEGLVYDGQPHQLVDFEFIPGDVWYEWIMVTVNGVRGEYNHLYLADAYDQLTVTDAGDYVIKLEVYNSRTEQVVTSWEDTVTIAPRDLELQVSDVGVQHFDPENIKDYTINDFTYTVVNDGLLAGDEVSLSSNAVRNAGTHTLYLILAGEDAHNYTLGEKSQKTVKFTMEPWTASMDEVIPQVAVAYTGNDLAVLELGGELFSLVSGVTVTPIALENAGVEVAGVRDVGEYTLHTRVSFAEELKGNLALTLPDGTVADGTQTVDYPVNVTIEKAARNDASWSYKEPVYAPQGRDIHITDIVDSMQVTIKNSGTTENVDLSTLERGVDWEIEGVESYSDLPVGTYKLNVHLDEKNYSTTSASGTFTLAGTLLAGSFGVSCGVSSHEYNGSAQALLENVFVSDQTTGSAVVLPTGEAAQWSISYALSEEGPYSADMPTATDAGTYPVYVRAHLVSDQYAAQAGPVKLQAQITPVRVNVSYISSYDYTYSDAMTHDAVKAAAEEDIVEKLARYHGIEFSADELVFDHGDNSYTDIGRYTVIVKTAEGGNYSFEGAIYNIGINGSMYNIAKPLVYTGEAFEAEDFIDWDKVEVQAVNGHIPQLQAYFTGGIETVTDAGEYSVIIKAADVADEYSGYYYYNSISKAVVKPQEIDLEIVGTRADGEEYPYSIYGYEWWELVRAFKVGPYTVTEEDLDIEYELIGNGTSDSYYRVTARLLDTWSPEDTKNYTVSSKEAVKDFHIALGADVFFNPNENLVYNAAPQQLGELMLGSNAENPHVEVYVDNELKSENEITAKDAGEHTVRILIYEDASKANLLLETSDTVTIAPKVLDSETLDDIVRVEYDGQAHDIYSFYDGYKLSAVYQADEGHVNVVSTQTGTDAGEYTLELGLTGDRADNYVIADDLKTQTVTIHPRTVELMELIPRDLGTLYTFNNREHTAQDVLIDILSRYDLPECVTVRPGGIFDSDGGTESVKDAGDYEIDLGYEIDFADKNYKYLLNGSEVDESVDLGDLVCTFTIAKGLVTGVNYNSVQTKFVYNPTRALELSDMVDSIELVLNHDENATIPVDVENCVFELDWAFWNLSLTNKGVPVGEHDLYFMPSSSDNYNISSHLALGVSLPDITVRPALLEGQFKVVVENKEALVYDGGSDQLLFKDWYLWEEVTGKRFDTLPDGSPVSFVICPVVNGEPDRENAVEYPMASEAGSYTYKFYAQTASENYLLPVDAVMEAEATAVMEPYPVEVWVDRRDVEYRPGITAQDFLINDTAEYEDPNYNPGALSISAYFDVALDRPVDSAGDYTLILTLKENVVFENLLFVDKYFPVKVTKASVDMTALIRENEISYKFDGVARTAGDLADMTDFGLEGVSVQGDLVRDANGNAQDSIVHAGAYQLQVTLTLNEKAQRSYDLMDDEGNRLLMTDGQVTVNVPVTIEKNTVGDISVEEGTTSFPYAHDRMLTLDEVVRSITLNMEDGAAVPVDMEQFVYGTNWWISDLATGLAFSGDGMPDAGNYSVRIDLDTNSQDYEYASDIDTFYDIEIGIVPADISDQFEIRVEGNTHTYNKEAQPLLTNVTVVDKDTQQEVTRLPDGSEAQFSFSYLLVGENMWKREMPTGTDAGEYTMSINAAQRSGNYRVDLTMDGVKAYIRPAEVFMDAQVQEVTFGEDIKPEDFLTSLDWNIDGHWVTPEKGAYTLTLDPALNGAGEYVLVINAADAVKNSDHNHVYREHIVPVTVSRKMITDLIVNDNILMPYKAAGYTKEQLVEEALADEYSDLLEVTEVKLMGVNGGGDLAVKPGGYILEFKAALTIDAAGNYVLGDKNRNQVDSLTLSKDVTIQFAEPRLVAEYKDPDEDSVPYDFSINQNKQDAIERTALYLVYDGAKIPVPEALKVGYGWEQSAPDGKMFELSISVMSTDPYGWNNGVARLESGKRLYASLPFEVRPTALLVEAKDDLYYTGSAQLLLNEIIATSKEEKVELVVDVTVQEGEPVSDSAKHNTWVVYADETIWLDVYGLRNVSGLCGIYNVDVSLVNERGDVLESKQVQVEIKKQPVQLELGEAADVYYDAQPHGILDFYPDARLVKPNGSAVDASVSLLSDTVTSAGEHELTLSLSDSNYELAEEDKTVACSILNTVVATWYPDADIVQESYVYNGTAHGAEDFVNNVKLNLLVSTESGALQIEFVPEEGTYIVCVQDPDKEQFASDDFKPKDAGEYRLYVKLVGEVPGIVGWSGAHALGEKAVITPAQAVLGGNYNKVYGDDDPAGIWQVEGNEALNAEAGESLEANGYRVLREAGEDTGTYNYLGVYKESEGEASAVDSISSGNFNYSVEDAALEIIPRPVISIANLTLKELPYRDTGYAAEDFVDVSGESWKLILDNGEEYVLSDPLSQLKFAFTNGADTLKEPNESVLINVTLGEELAQNYSYTLGQTESVIVPAPATIRVTTREITFDGGYHYGVEFVEKAEIMNAAGTVLYTFEGEALDNGQLICTIEGNYPIKADANDDRTFTVRVSDDAQEITKYYNVAPAENLEAKINPLPVRMYLTQDIEAKYLDAFYYADAQFAWEADVEELAVRQMLDGMAAMAQAFVEDERPGAGEHEFSYAWVEPYQLPVGGDPVDIGNYALTFDPNGKKLIVSPLEASLTVSRATELTYSRDAEHAWSDFGAILGAFNAELGAEVMSFYGDPGVRGYLEDALGNRMESVTDAGEYTLHLYLDEESESYGNFILAENDATCTVRVLRQTVSGLDYTLAEVIYSGEEIDLNSLVRGPVQVGTVLDGMITLQPEDLKVSYLQVYDNHTDAGYYEVAVEIVNEEFLRNYEEFTRFDTVTVHSLNVYLEAEGRNVPYTGSVHDLSEFVVAARLVDADGNLVEEVPLDSLGLEINSTPAPDLIGVDNVDIDVSLTLTNDNYWLANDTCMLNVKIEPVKITVSPHEGMSRTYGQDDPAMQWDAQIQSSEEAVTQEYMQLSRYFEADYGEGHLASVGFYDYLTLNVVYPDEMFVINKDEEVKVGNFLITFAPKDQFEVKPLPVKVMGTEDTYHTWGDVNVSMDYAMEWNEAESMLTDSEVRDALQALITVSSASTLDVGEHPLVMLVNGNEEVLSGETRLMGNYRVTYENEYHCIVEPLRATLRVELIEEMPAYLEGVRFVPRYFVKDVYLVCEDGETVLYPYDYKISFQSGESDVTNAGEYKLQVRLTEDSEYFGNVSVAAHGTTADVQILKAQGSISTLGILTEYIYNGKQQTVTGAVLYHDECELVYANNTFTTVAEGNGMTVTITAAETDNYLGAQEQVTITVLPADIAGERVTVDAIEDVRVTGSEVKPEPQVKFNGEVLVNGEDYVLEYADNVEAGEGKVIIKGQGNFTGEKTVTFNILPPAATPTPTVKPTARPTEGATDQPTATPTAKPTDSATDDPAATPTAKPTDSATDDPAATPTARPTDSATDDPAATPTAKPTDSVTDDPSDDTDATPAPTGTERPAHENLADLVGSEETDVPPTIVFDESYAPEHYELLSIITDEATGARILLICAQPEGDGTVSQRSLILSGKQLVQLTEEEKVAYILFENGDGMVTVKIEDVLAAAEGIENLPESYEMEICIAPDEQAGYRFSVGIRMSGQTVDVSDKLPSLTVGINVDALVQDTGAEGLADRYALTLATDAGENALADAVLTLIPDQLLEHAERYSVAVKENNCYSTMYTLSVHLDAYRHQMLTAPYAGEGLYSVKQK